MASSLIIFLYLILVTTTATSGQESAQQPQLNTIIDSIVGAGDFSNWANLLSKADPSIFPLSATFFIPDDDAVVLATTNSTTSSSSSSVNYVDPLLFPYHVIPRRFAFAELLQFPIGARLPTLLPGNTLVITNNSASNFTINAAKLTHPNLFHNSVVAVHGVAAVLDYALFGKEDNNASVVSPPPQNSAYPFSPEKSPEQDLFVGAASPPSVVFKQEESRGMVIESPKSAAPAVFLRTWPEDEELLALVLILWIFLF